MDVNALCCNTRQCPMPTRLGMTMPYATRLACYFLQASPAVATLPAPETLVCHIQPVCICPSPPWPFGPCAVQRFVPEAGHFLILLCMTLPCAPHRPPRHIRALVPSPTPSACAFPKHILALPYSHRRPIHGFTSIALRRLCLHSCPRLPCRPVALPLQSVRCIIGRLPCPCLLVPRTPKSLLAVLLYCCWQLCSGPASAL